MSQLSHALSQMPSAKVGLDQLLDDLRQGRSVLGLLPQGIGTEVLQSVLWNELESYDLRIDEISIDEYETLDPVSSVFRSLGLANDSEEPTPFGVEYLLSQVGVLPEVLFIDGFNNVGKDSRLAWLRFIVRWAELCKAKNSSSFSDPTIPSAICLLTNGKFVPYPLPRTDLFLNIHVWWNIPTVLELRLLCRLASDQFTGLSSYWMESIIPELSGSNLRLADFLWNRKTDTHIDLVSSLSCYAEEQNWELSEIKEISRQDFSRLTTDNQDFWWSSPDLYRAWAHELVYWTPEYGFEISSAVLAMLDRREDLDHRIWRGQVGRLLPELDKTRLILCEHLNRSYGHDWPYKWYEPETERELMDLKNNPFSCQWGHLTFLLHRRELYSKREFKRLAHCSSNIRNKLAHYKPIELAEYEIYCGERAKLTSQL